LLLSASCRFRLFPKGLRQPQRCRCTLWFEREFLGSERNLEGSSRTPSDFVQNSRTLRLPATRELPGRLLSDPKWLLRTTGVNARVRQCPALPCLATPTTQAVATRRDRLAKRLVGEIHSLPCPAGR
jgi:hypothetical protein